MSMPKGHKSKQGYATVTDLDGGLDYRTIAKKMSDSGDKMNHATARNIFLRAMKKLATPVCEMYELSNDAEKIEKTARDPRFQSSMIELITDIYESDSKINI